MLQFKLYHESNEKALKIFQQEKTLLDFFCTINVNYGACHAYTPFCEKLTCTLSHAFHHDPTPHHWQINTQSTPNGQEWSHDQSTQAC